MRSADAWVFFDGDCSFCRRMVERFSPGLEARGFGLAALQETWVRERLGGAADTIPDEMKVLTAQNTILGGADAVIFLASRFWWAWPVSILARLPLLHQAAHYLYRWIARNRHCLMKAQ